MREHTVSDYGSGAMDRSERFPDELRSLSGQTEEGMSRLTEGATLVRLTVADIQ